MTVLPIIDRELRVAARRRGTYYGRVLAAALALGLGGWFYWVFERIGGTGFGARELFLILTSMILAQCLLSGANRTADCLSQENREGTLGLLFLTDLKGHDIVLGKLLANSLASVYGLIATFPVLAIVLLIGGISGKEFGLVMLNLLNALIFSLSLGILVSSLSKKQKRAATVSALLMVFFGAVIPLTSELLRMESPFPMLGVFLNLFSPVYTHRMAFSFLGPLSASEFWRSFFVVLAMSAGFLVLSSYITPRSWQDKPGRLRRPSWRERLAERRLGQASMRRAFRTWALRINPYYWLASRDQFSKFWLWLCFGVVSLWDLGVFTLTEWNREAITTLNIMLFVVVMKVLVVTAACHRFGEDRQNGALELLLSTPLTVQSILRGQMLALTRQFAAPLFFSILVPSLLVSATGMFHEGYNSWGENWVFVFILFELISVIDLVALCWVGMWMALRVKQPAHASGAAFLRIVLTPYLIFAAFSTLLGLLGVWANGDGPGFFPMFVIWLALALGNDLFFVMRARAKLRSQFRLAATDRFQLERLSFWGRLWRGQTKTPTSSPNERLSVDARNQ